MKIFTEREAEEFLSKHSFDILETFFVNKEKGLEEVLKKVNYPIVIKVSGKKIIHKKAVSGVKLGLVDYKSSIKAFNELMRINGADGVLIQKQIKGKEFLLGLKKTPEFGHILSFGYGGSSVEKVADISFRAIPLDKPEILDMIKETEVGKKLNSSETNLVLENLLKLQNLANNNSNISELDINPLILNEKQAVVVDARIAWE